MRKKIKSVYLSGGISGVDNYKANFSRAYALVGGCGFAVVSPVLIGQMVEHRLRRKKEITWFDYMRGCVGVLAHCDAIAMLPGWQKSKGARIELRIAKDLGLEILTISKNYDSLIK
jgi:hypothetical protein